MRIGQSKGSNRGAGGATEKNEDTTAAVGQEDDNAGARVVQRPASMRVSATAGGGGFLDATTNTDNVVQMEGWLKKKSPSKFGRWQVRVESRVSGEGGWF